MCGNNNVSRELDFWMLSRIKVRVKLHRKKCVLPSLTFNTLFIAHLQSYRFRIYQDTSKDIHFIIIILLF